MIPVSRSAVHWPGAGNAHRPARPARVRATGRQSEGDGVNVWEYRDGRICRLRICLDRLGVSRQLGLMPPVGSRTERAGAQLVTTKLRQAVLRRSGR